MKSREEIKKVMIKSERAIESLPSLGRLKRIIKSSGRVITSIYVLVSNKYGRILINLDPVNKFYRGTLKSLITSHKSCNNYKKFLS